MAPSPSLVAERFPGVGLEQLDAGAALQDRVETKYVILLADFSALADRLLGTHAVLAIEGRRAFAYRSTYFDTADLSAYRAHIQQRRRRFKCRSREYLDSGTCAFEVKLKGLRGRTVKHRMAHEGDQLSDAAAAFLRQCLERAYVRPPDRGLHAVLTVACTRVTLVAPALGERVTCDYDLTFTGPDGASGRLDPGMAIVESKSARGSAVADRVLRELGHRPVTGCSKYCLGVALTREVPRNALRPLLRRAFLPA
jgi:VTC domain-containing protein